MDTAVKILCDVAEADPAASDVIVDRSLPVLTEVMRRDEIEDKVKTNIKGRDYRKYRLM